MKPLEEIFIELDNSWRIIRALEKERTSSGLRHQHCDDNLATSASGEVKKAPRVFWSIIVLIMLWAGEVRGLVDGLRLQTDRAITFPWFRDRLLPFGSIPEVR
jgi:hypothetical protein